MHRSFGNRAMILPGIRRTEGLILPLYGKGSSWTIFKIQRNFSANLYGNAVGRISAAADESISISDTLGLGPGERESLEGDERFTRWRPGGIRSARRKETGLTRQRRQADCGGK